MAKFSQPKKVPQQKFFTTSCPHDEMYQRLSVLASKNPYSKVSHGESFFTAKCPTAKFTDSKRSHGKKSLKRCNQGELYLRLGVLAAKNPCGKVSRDELFYGEKSHGKIFGHVQTQRQLQHQAERRGLSCNL